jgi:hypothetical protein
MARNGERPSSPDSANPVRVGLANEEGFPHGQSTSSITS